ncbi:MAG: DUF327 family protein [Leptospirales bacterium]
MLSHIQNTNRSASKPGKSGEKRTKATSSPVGDSFGSLFGAKVEETTSVESPVMSDVDDMMVKLENLEQNLISEPSVSNYSEYKEQLQKLLKKVMKQAFTIRTFRDLEKREFEVVKVIDRTMKELYSKIAKSDGDLNGVISLLGKIKGIILDIRV